MLHLIEYMNIYFFVRLLEKRAIKPSVLEKRLLLSLSGSESGDRTCDPSGPVTHSESLTEERPHWTGEPPTPTILMTHVEPLKQDFCVTIDALIHLLGSHFIRIS